MANITFYTKSGCATSVKQIELLRRSGHMVEVRDLIAHPWQSEELTSYFGDLPVSGWFNPNSPRVRSGEIDPARFDAQGALALMLTDHLLIRRPLMESGETRLCGFEAATVHAWVGLAEELHEESSKEDYTSCSQPSVAGQQCP